MRRLIFWLGLGLVVLCSACGGSDSNASKGSAGSGGGSKVSSASCYKQCETQASTQGCTSPVTLSECKLLCDGLARATPEACADEFDAYYNCSASDGFNCTSGLVVQKTNACKDKQDAYGACMNGGTKPTCQGALPSGVCPSVQCPCKSGAKPVSGFDQSGSTCRCYDATTCLDFFCD